MTKVDLNLEEFFTAIRAQIETIKAEVHAITDDGSDIGTVDGTGGTNTGSIVFTNSGLNTENTFSVSDPAVNVIEIPSDDGDDTTIISGPVVNVVLGGLDIDTFDFRDSDSPAFVDLGNRISISDGDVSILSSIENVIGTESGDVLLGSADSNVFYGNGGSDFINGRGGVDVVQFEGKAEDFDIQTITKTIDDEDFLAVTVSKDGDTSTIIGVEFLQFRDGSEDGDEKIFQIIPREGADGDPDGSIVARRDDGYTGEDSGDEGGMPLMLQLLDNDDFVGAVTERVISISDENGENVVSTLDDDGNFVILGEFGTLTVSPDGKATYTTDDRADVLTGDVSGTDLKGGMENGVETFLYEVPGGDTALITIDVHGENDIAVITGNDTGMVIEAGQDEFDPIDHSQNDIGTPTASGQLMIEDADFHQDMFVVASSLEGKFGTFTFDETTGEWEYTLDDNNKLVNALNVGDHLWDELQIDSKDGTAWETIVVTIKGTNDNPVVTSPAQHEYVAEIEDGAHGETSAHLIAKGHIGLKDVDSDFGLPEYRSAGSISNSRLKELISIKDTEFNYRPDDPNFPDSVDTALFSNLFVIDFGWGGIDSSVGWLNYTFAVQDGAIEFLGKGDELDITYTLKIEDGDGGFTTTELKVTVQGSNDAITAVVSSPDMIIEDPETTGELQDIMADGVLTINDIDIGDEVSITEGDTSVALNGETLEGDDIPSQIQNLIANDLLSFENNIETTGGEFTSNFTYTANAADLDFLGKDDVLTLIIPVTVADSDHPDASQSTVDVTITIKGTNDAPTVDAIVATNVVEDGGLHADEATSASGNILNDGNASDVDNDFSELFVSQAKSVTGDGSPQTVNTNGVINVAGIYGTLVIMADGGYEYNLFDTSTEDGEALNALKQGQEVTDVFSFTVADGDHGTDVANLTINVTGTNDTPVITAEDGKAWELADTTGSDAIVEAKGAITTTDVDGNEVKVTILDNDDNSPSILWSGGDLSEDEVATLLDGLVLEDGQWRFSVTDSELDFLGEGETLDVSFTLQADDGERVKNSTSETDVTVTIDGSNDRPVVTKVWEGVDDTELTGDSPLIGLVGDNVTDADRNDEVSVVDGSEHGDLTISLDQITGDTGLDLSVSIEALESAGLISFDSNGDVTLESGFASVLNELLEDDDAASIEGTFTVTDDSGATNATAEGAFDVTIDGTGDLSDDPQPFYGADNKPDFLVDVDGDAINTEAYTPDPHPVDDIG